MKTIEVKDIKPGMVLFYTKEAVLTYPCELSKRGNMDFMVNSSDGIVRKSFNRHKLVAVAA